MYTTCMFVLKMQRKKKHARLKHSDNKREVLLVKYLNRTLLNKAAKNSVDPNITTSRYMLFEMLSRKTN